METAGSGTLRLLLLLALAGAAPSSCERERQTENPTENALLVLTSALHGDGNPFSGWSYLPSNVVDTIIRVCDGASRQRYR